MTRSSVLLLLLFLSSAAFAQRYDPLHPPNTFRQADNPHYWKNNMPYPGYWQQDVHYDMQVRLDEVNDLAEGTVQLTYWNNSPDTLREVFFHLYANAAKPNSYLARLSGRGNRPLDRNRGTEVARMTMDGQEATVEVDNTIMRVDLPRPLLPGQAPCSRTASPRIGAAWAA